MKKNTHPEYQKVLFVDSTTGKKFICGSTLKPSETAEFEGQTYPVFHLSTSCFSHPFFTGSRQHADQEGRIDRFQKRYAAVQEKRQKEAETGKSKKPAPKKK